MPTSIETYSTAKGYVQSAFALMAGDTRVSQQNDISFFLSFHLMLGFATELYLKALLSHSGVSEADLKKYPLAHDLAELQKLADQKGLKLPQSSPPLIAYLAENHKNHAFRYMGASNKYEALPLNLLFEWLSDLDLYVDGVVGASKSHGKTASGTWIFPAANSNWRFQLPPAPPTPPS